jgi:DNA-directed RNA polymerase specialized sigma24 family protein
VKQAPTIAEVIASLPEEERFILTMHLLKGMSADQIAKALGVPVKSVNALISGGKARLVALLDFPPSA